MGLAKNLYRRQATYWWRRRFADPLSGQSRTIAFSLRVQQPSAARRIADALNARAHALAQRLELRMSTFEDAQQDLFSVVERAVWTLDPRAEAQLLTLEQRARVAIQGRRRGRADASGYHALH